MLAVQGGPPGPLPAPSAQDAGPHLDWWLAWACVSRIPTFVELSRIVQANRDRILATVELGLSNSEFEILNSKIQLINHRLRPSLCVHGHVKVCRRRLKP